jgi:hypothetical protein
MSTLIEKFKNVFIQHYSNDWEKQCVNVAEDFAIGFAIWIAKEYWLNSSEKYTQGQTNEELLEIYKREKGL